jgi:hypothetical protein
MQLNERGFPLTRTPHITIGPASLITYEPALVNPSEKIKHQDGKIDEFLDKLSDLM